jgi:iron(III) transport system substrate-binding protein
MTDIRNADGRITGAQVESVHALDANVDRRTLLRQGLGLGLALPIAGAVSGAVAQPAASYPPELAPLVEAAKKEGVVTVTGNLLQSEEGRRKVGEGFRAYYGLPESFKVDILTKNVGPLQKQVEDEITAKKVSIDVITLNVVPWFYSLAQRGKLISFDAPSYEGYKHWDATPGYNHRPFYVSDPTMLFSIVWNTEIIKDNEFSSWFDVLRPEYKGKITSVSANLGASTAVMYKTLRENAAIGNEFFKGLAKLDLVTMPLTYAAVGKVISGEYPITISPGGHVFSQWRRGARNFAQSYPKEGVGVLPAPWVAPADCPHPNAAKLMLHFGRTREGQTIIANIEGQPTGRADITIDERPYVRTKEKPKLILIDQREIKPQEIRALGRDWKEMYGT